MTAHAIAHRTAHVTAHLTAHVTAHRTAHVTAHMTTHVTAHRTAHVTTHMTAHVTAGFGTRATHVSARVTTNVTTHALPFEHHVHRSRPCNSSLLFALALSPVPSSAPPGTAVVIPTPTSTYTRAVGSALYMAPEVEAERAYSLPADIFSFGT